MKVFVMEKISNQLTVFFEDPFWVGVFERVENGVLSAAKVTFGAEPKDYDVYACVLKYYNRLQFSKGVEILEKESHKNPKRMQREAKKQLKESGIGTKSQQALKLMHDENKNKRKKKSRMEKLEEEKRLFAMKQQKKKEKKKGH